MVKKLIKQEFIYYIRSLLPMELILLGIALMTRFIQFFENRNTAYSIVSGSSVFAFVVAIIACIAMTVISCITRFYRNLYTSEGYLTFALPVTESQHIFSKLITAVAVNVITFINIVLSVCIATAGELCLEIFKSIWYIIKRLHTDTDIGGNFIGYVIEFSVLMIVSLAVGLLLFYGCITIGQTAKKNRVVAAIGVYFAYYFIVQILETIAVVIISTGILSEIIDIYAISRFMEQHFYLSIHIALLTSIVFYLLLGTLYFFITRFVMKKKLNLE